MANLAYRSIAAGNWSNGTGTVWAVYSNAAVGGVFASGGTWSTVGPSVYPTAGDYVWMQSTFSVVYDATIIAAMNSSSFALISGNTAAVGLAVAQPGTGGVNLTTGNINLGTNGTNATINATYYAMLTSTAGLFNCTTSSTTYNFSGTWYEGTTGTWLNYASGGNNTFNITGNLKSSVTSGNAITLSVVGNINIIGNFTAQGGTGISNAGSGSIINITGDLTASQTGTVYAITTPSVIGTINITGNVYSGVNQSAIYAPIPSSSVTVTGNVRNYGSSGVTSYMAIICPVVNIKSTATLQFRTSDAGTKDFVTTGVDPSVTVANIWSYATRTLTAATNITSDGSTISQTQLGRLDTTISSRAAASTALDNTVWTNTKAGYIDAAVSTRAVPGDAMALTTSERTSVATSVWAAATRTLTSFGTLAADVWSSVTRTLTGATNITSDGNTIDQTKIANLDATVSSRLATSGYTAPDNTSIIAIKAKTDNLPANPASQTNLDVAVSTRLAAASYTAPDNTTISTINTNVSSLQSVTGTINTNVSGAQAVLGGVQSVTLSTQTTVVGIQGSTDRIPLNPASVQTTGDQIASLQ